MNKYNLNHAYCLNILHKTHTHVRTHTHTTIFQIIAPSPKTEQTALLVAAIIDEAHNYQKLAQAMRYKFLKICIKALLFCIRVLFINS